MAFCATENAHGSPKDNELGLRYSRIFAIAVQFSRSGKTMASCSVPIIIIILIIMLRSGMIDRCRKCDEGGEKIEHVIDGISDSAYLGRHNQLAKIIHQQTAKKYKLLE